MVTGNAKMLVGPRSMVRLDCPGGKPGPTHDDFLEIARRVIWVRNQTGEGVPTPDAELLARAYSMSPDEFGDAMLEITEFEVNQIELEGRI